MISHPATPSRPESLTSSHQQRVQTEAPSRPENLPSQTPIYQLSAFPRLRPINSDSGAPPPNAGAWPVAPGFSVSGVASAKLGVPRCFAASRSRFGYQGAACQGPTYAAQGLECVQLHLAALNGSRKHILPGAAGEETLRERKLSLSSQFPVTLLLLNLVS